MKEQELLNRLREVNGATTVFNFWSDTATNTTIQSAKDLESKGKIDLVELEQYDAFSVAITAKVK